MAAMTPGAFVAKWSKIRQKETAVYASHFDDLCRLVGHATPTEYAARHDPRGETFSFQMTTLKAGGQKGFADVFFRDRFIWEYKGLHADLDRAYRQLQLYREALGNPPLLITSDVATVRIHSNFTNRPTTTTVVTLDDIAAGPGVEVLRRVFYDPQSFEPEDTRQNITRATADTFLAVADALRQHQELSGEEYSPEQRAHFLIRLLFCLFAEDLGLLPTGLFSQIVSAQGRAYTDLRHPLRNLFATMRDGGHFGMFAVRHFNGALFDNDFVPGLPFDLARQVQRAAAQNWSAVDPSIFGTLFERVIDQGKRAQLGAHYTSEADIKLIVEPVLMEPLRRRWDEVRRATSDELRVTSDDVLDSSLVERQESLHRHSSLAQFAAELAAVRVLDPACGSGNFLYVALRRLLELQKEVIAFAARKGLPPIPLTVGPQQLYGIEKDEYAHELAQVTVWIGYLQWRQENGFASTEDPVLRPLNNIRRMDAILAHDADGRPVEPEWPAAEVIVGNPPFLGGNKIRQELGDAYVDSLFKLYSGRMPAFADLVCYWFEKARKQIELGDAKRAGLLATNSIRGGVNRTVLERIKQTGDIFMAWSDNPWVLDGAAVRVSIVGFDDAQQQVKHLDGNSVTSVNPDLTATKADVTQAGWLRQNQNISFQGPSPKGRFDIEADLARKMLLTEANREVVRPVISAIDITRGSRGLWTIDFAQMTLEEAQRFDAPFKYVVENVYPERSKNRRESYAEKWWQYAESRPGMRQALHGLKRFIVTPRVSKHRTFIWAEPRILANDGTIVFARDDDYFFGVLHARPHELWALRMGTSLEDRPRYTPTTTFETYPFPWPPGAEPAEGDDPRRDDIARQARALVAWRDAWLNPPPPPARTMDVTYDRLLKARTLTNLYNGLAYWRAARPAGARPAAEAWQRAEFDAATRRAATPEEIEELDDFHRALDAAVLRAYGWPEGLDDEAVLERLLALNRERG